MHAADDVELCAHMYHTRRAAAHEQIKLLRFRLLDGVFGGVGVRMSVAARLCVTYRFPCAKCTATCNRVCVCVLHACAISRSWKIGANSQFSSDIDLLRITIGFLYTRMWVCVCLSAVYERTTNSFVFISGTYRILQREHKQTKNQIKSNVMQDLGRQYWFHVHAHAESLKHGRFK